MSLTEFAKAIKVGRNTVIANESGEREPKDHEIDRMAEVSGLPVEFFTVPDLRAALAGEASGDGGDTPPIWLAVAEISDRLRRVEKAVPIKPADVAARADSRAAALRLQGAVRSLQERARHLSQEAQDAAADTS